MTSVQSSEVSNRKLDTVSETVNLGCEYEFGPEVEDVTTHEFGSSFGVGIYQIPRSTLP